VTYDDKKRGLSDILKISHEIDEYSIKFTIFNKDTSSILTIPTPFMRDGIQLLRIGSVERPTCVYYKRKEDKCLDYMDMISESLFNDMSSQISSVSYRGQINSIKHIRFAHRKGSFQRGVHNVQRVVNELVNLLPVYTTNMNGWVVNRRISIIDDDFDTINNPADKHSYQVAKNEEFFDRGWSSLGLSDGSLASDNYMLSVDLRSLTPFGFYHHNPQRNLYSTLGMRGDETPLVMSETMAKLKEENLFRTGWNLFTVFVDIPDVYEDQLMVDISHQDKYVDYSKKVHIYGDVLVSENDTIHTEDVVAVDKNEKLVRFSIPCDSAFVESITKEETIIDGEIYEASVLNLQCRRFLKDGAKLTNLAANKGIIRMKDLGYAIDPSTGKERKIDVIVSSKAVLKRQNYTQVVEAILNTVNKDNEIVLKDGVSTSEESLSKSLVQSGYNADGTWKCKTYVGDFDCVCGTVFWGLTHDADDTIWEDRNTIKEDTYGLRRSGLKFSTIEFRALQTRFGKDSPIEKEVLSYSQGGDNVEELLNIIDSKCGIVNEAVDILHYSDVLPITDDGTFFDPIHKVGTFLDENFYPDGFMLKLPVKYQVIIDEQHNTLAEGFPSDEVEYIEGKKVFKQIVLDKIYIPCYNVRQCWTHQVGKCGHSDISRIINDLLVSCRRYDEEGMDVLSNIYGNICRYFKTVSRMLGSKKGKISILGMSIRYPKSAKAVATLSNDLPKDTVEIHEHMAKNLGVKTGDVVMVERFPCLGFMSIRPQYVRVTNDIQCRYTIRASGNSLGSMTLDFDGDVLYIASFHTKEAKEMLKKEMLKPNELCQSYIEEFNSTMGTPRFKEMSLFDYKITNFEPLTVESHAEIIGKLSGVKNYTGPVVALAYNLLRIAETSDVVHDQKFNCEIEVFMNTIANSVFKQKHGVKSLHQVVTDAVCLADTKTLIKEGFSKDISEILCATITRKANLLGVNDLKRHHAEHLDSGRSNIINFIVRNENKLYFASRSILDATRTRFLLRNYNVVDIPSEMFRKISDRRASLKRDKRLKSIVEAAGVLVDTLLPNIVNDQEKYFNYET
jgi:hypothetical protein